MPRAAGRVGACRHQAPEEARKREDTCAAQVYNRGKEVNVPAETVLSFRLNQPMLLS
jgi:hypothetical protein